MKLNENTQPEHTPQDRAGQPTLNWIARTAKFLFAWRFTIYDDQWIKPEPSEIKGHYGGRWVLRRCTTNTESV